MDYNEQTLWKIKPRWERANLQAYVFIFDNKFPSYSFFS